MFLLHPRVKVSIVGSLREREVACSASDRQGSNFESCVWRAVSSQSSHHPQEFLLAQFSLYVHKGGLKPDSFHFFLFCSALLLVCFVLFCCALFSLVGGGPRVVVSTAAFHARVRGSVPGLGGLKETKLFLPHPRVKVSIVGSLRDREVACSASDRQGSNFESCVWRTVSSQSSYHPQEVLLAQFSLYVHKGGLKPDSFHFVQSCRLAVLVCCIIIFFCSAPFFSALLYSTM